MSNRVEKLLSDIMEKRIEGSVKITLACLDTIRELSSTSTASSSEEFIKNLTEACIRLQEARPGLFLLQNGLQYVMNYLNSAFEKGATLKELRASAISSTGKFQNLIKESIDKIATVGANYISDGDTILTHGCSTTVLAVITRARQSGKRFEIITTETRPELHGRLFAMAAADLGIPITLIVDSAHRQVMSRVKKVFLGAVAISPEGYVLGRVGTSMVAHSARQMNVAVYITASVSKLCPDEKVWEKIHTAERDPTPIFPPAEAGKLGIKVFNPTYDVTPPEDITQIITERGATPPSAVRALIDKVLDLPRRQV